MKIMCFLLPICLSACGSSEMKEQFTKETLNTEFGYDLTKIKAYKKAKPGLTALETYLFDKDNLSKINSKSMQCNYYVSRLSNIYLTEKYNIWNTEKSNREKEFIVYDYCMTHAFVGNKKINPRLKVWLSKGLEVINVKEIDSVVHNRKVTYITAKSSDGGEHILGMIKEMNLWKKI